MPDLIDLWTMEPAIESGHYLPQANPDATARALLAFFLTG
jgi:hypothetical protein